MKVVEVRSAFLTNFEVSKHLEALTALQDSMLQKGSYSSALESENLRTVQFELKNYLDEQPCQVITPEKLVAFLKEIKEGELSLTKAEKLMILNQIPGNEAEISVLLEEYSDRFTETQREDLLEVISRNLGKRLPSSGQENEDENDKNNADEYEDDETMKSD
ncbi:DNA-directed RNA polymerase III subunit rpc9 [Taphrina deformans PYCC 5710]|uniref:DNA-directed RNA polymerase III subunit RPC9 n=1 Tax=Taphrina deformans (strain PYCC 5710 / ATCC 11124 / CBS 356.35 / IMI 108563 / JCM 9778 / NBRC 8474) TaxID=1097556 RepID=R4X805_TAPDE|nr:DNA-directed RNA polymerase III subunit rpc9 [Taphrina deformans PYCC 5710]|eukprot:CCG81382.1 DNA-directed RNA polymerase III subunit rpc9 [Taphrina deformans PYCC 5710]